MSDQQNHVKYHGDTAWLQDPDGPWKLERPAVERDNWAGLLQTHRPVTVWFDNGIEWDAWVSAVSVPLFIERPGRIELIGGAPLDLTLQPTEAPRLDGVDLTVEAYWEVVNAP